MHGWTDEDKLQMMNEGIKESGFTMLGWAAEISDYSDFRKMHGIKVMCNTMFLCLYANVRLK